VVEREVVAARADPLDELVTVVGAPRVPGLTLRVDGPERRLDERSTIHR
jgi:hypothetical protein